MRFSSQNRVENNFDHLRRAAPDHLGMPSPARGLFRGGTRTRRLLRSDGSYYELLRKYSEKRSSERVIEAPPPGCGQELMPGADGVLDDRPHRIL